MSAPRLAPCYRPRVDRDQARGRLVFAKAQASGKSALDAAMIAIEATFGAASVINRHKRDVERWIRLSYGHPEVRARFAHFIRLFAVRGVDLDEACAMLAAECHARHKLPLARMVRAELHLILRWMRAKRMHRDFVETLWAVQESGSTRVVAATSVVGDEFVVCEGNALGPVVARFPRTEEGHKAALAMAGAE